MYTNFRLKLNLNYYLLSRSKNVGLSVDNMDTAIFIINPPQKNPNCDLFLLSHRGLSGGSLAEHF